MCAKVEPVHLLALKSLFPCHLTFSDVPNYSPEKIGSLDLYKKIYDYNVTYT